MATIVQPGVPRPQAKRPLHPSAASKALPSGSTANGSTHQAAVSSRASTEGEVRAGEVYGAENTLDITDRDEPAAPRAWRCAGFRVPEAHRVAEIGCHRPGAPA